MELMSSVLKSEIVKLNAAPQQAVVHTWELTVHTPTEDIKALYLHWVKQYSNYTTHFADELMAACSFPAGTYDHVIYQQRDDLQVTLKKVYLENNGTVSIASPQKEEEVLRYRCKLFDTRSSRIEQNQPIAQERDRLDASQTRDVKLQLIHPLIDFLRKTSTGGVFHRCRGVDAVRAFLGKETRKAAAECNVPFLGVDIASGFNQELCDNIMVPDHTPIEEIPQFINDDVGGIYPTGFWYYIHDKHWFLYPKMDLQRYYSHTGLRLKVINVPDRKLPDAPKTFYIEDNLLTVLATGETRQIDLAEMEQENKGNGTRFLNPNKLFNDYVKRDKNKAISNSAKVVSEVSVEPRRDGTNYTTLSDTPITSRFNNEYSKLASRNGMLVQFVWESALPDYIYPGMPASFVYLKNEVEVEELTGVVCSMEWQSTPLQTDTQNRQFQRKAAIQLFVGRGIDPTKVQPGSTGQGSIGLGNVANTGAMAGG